MDNKEKKYHHYVPQVYLNKFHHTKEVKGKRVKYFIYAYDKKTNNQLSINIADICAKNELYTIDSENIHERESIENFYSNTLEKDYNKFYNIIVDPEIKTITNDQRELIITSIVNLHLRNYFWLNVSNQFWSSKIEKYPEEFCEKVYDEHNNLLFDFSQETRSQIIKTDEQKNNQAFIWTHLELTLKWTEFHFHDLIIVDSAPGDSIYITSDKPVIVHTRFNSLRLPIDAKHMITLLPSNSINEENDSKILRKIDFFNPDDTNIMQYENAERFVIGSDPNIIQKAKTNYDNFPKH